MDNVKVKNKIFISIFVACLVSSWVCGGLLYIISPTLYDKVSLVETEKREMAQIEWGDLLNTGESISASVDDRIPFRFSLIASYKKLNDTIEAGYQIIETALGNLWYVPEEDATEEEELSETNVVEEAPVEEEAVKDEPQEVDNFYPLHVYQDVIIARDGWLFLYGENEIECYQGTNVLSEEQMKQYADKLNQLQTLCDSRGKELYIYIAPNKSSVYSKYMPTVEIVNSYRRIQQLYQYIHSNTTTQFLYPLENELVASGRYQVYYKYDSHWNHLGALFGVNALYDAMAIEYVDPSLWIVGTQDADKYELYTYMGIPDSMVTHDDIEWTMDYKPEITVEGLNTEAMICHTTSDGANDKRLCLIGDSFRVNMIPYLAKDFTSCTFVHRDYMNEVKADIKNSDVIVIEAVERYDYEAFSSVQRVINILTE